MKKFYTNVDTHRGKVLYRGVVTDDDGRLVQREFRKYKYEPTIFIPTKDPTEYRTIHGDMVAPKKFSSMWDCREYCEKMEHVHGFSIYGNLKHEYSYLYEQFGQGMDFDMDLILKMNIDIEVASENGFPEPSKAEEEITAISMDLNSKMTIVLGQDKYNTMPGGYKTNDPEVTYISCKDEDQLIEKFLDIWTTNYPDIVTGWNIKQFDMLYLYNRITKLFGEDYANLMSPWGIIYERKFKNDFQNDETTIVIKGVAQIDYLETYKKFSPKGKSQESYTLDHIGSVELGMKKLDYSEVETLHALYKTNFQKYIDYNIRDTRIVRGLEEKLKLIELVITLAYDSLTNYEDVFRQVRLWDIIITNWLMKDKIVVPPMVKNIKKEPYKGAFVKPPMVGMHKYVASFDLDSLYPHLIMQYNISPDTFVPPELYDGKMRKFVKEFSNDQLPKRMLELEENDVDWEWMGDYNVTFTPNGEFFATSEEGFLGEIMRTLYDDRKKFKRMMLDEKDHLERVKEEMRKRNIEIPEDKDQ
jgi:DNA polymerase elongation subunit (family B)